ncbi:MAG: HAD family hydrolase [Ignavibacteriaceae bacterium]|nr:HAD family hydrolase [Ignavibacteriaceae bacterium]
MFSKYDYIIWDWNGTLFNDVVVCSQIINGILIKYGYPGLTLERYRNIFTFPVVDYYREAGFDFSVHPFEIVGKEWMDIYEQRKGECAVFPEVFEVLDYFKSKGKKQFILSAYKQDQLQSIVNKFEITGYFDKILGLDNIWAHSKLDLGKDLLTNLNHGGKAILIGDTLHDHEVAVELGIDSVLVNTGHQTHERLIKSGVKVFNGLKELMG